MALFFGGKMTEEIYFALKDGSLLEEDFLSSISEESKLLLAGLIEQHELLYYRGSFALADKVKKCIYGKITSMKAYSAVVSLENGEECAIDYEDLNGGLLGDDVLVRLFKYDHSSGEIIYILKRANWLIFGEVVIFNGTYCLVNEMISPKNYRIFLKKNKSLVSYKEHDMVYCEVEAFYKGSCNAFVTKKMEVNGTFSKDVTHILLKNQAHLEFPYEVVEEARELPTWINNKEMKNRIDFRKHIIVTIDGDDAKDFDDAVEATLLEGNIEVGVHIADVSHYVLANSFLDKEAKERSQSIYVENKVVPMLPFELSNDICSLNPFVDRLVQSVRFIINSKGEVVSSSLDRGVICSAGRLTYKEVNAFLKKGKVSKNITEPISKSLLLLYKASSLLGKRFKKMGSLEIESIEHVFTLDSNGDVTDVKERKQDVAEQMIENLMICANEIVSKTMKKLDIPCVYRIHENPNVKRLENWMNLSEQFGFSCNFSPFEVTPKELQKHLLSIKDKEKRKLISNHLLRALAKAKYSIVQKGHFGLALKDYCHFTSPIRRYPDLLVHRLLDEYYFDHKGRKVDKKVIVNLEEESYKASIIERRILQIEREVDDLLCAKYMKQFVGSSFSGIIVSMTSKGMFIELENGIDGFLPFEYISTYVYYDEWKGVVSSRKGVLYHLGESLEVLLESSDPMTRQITFSLLKNTKKSIIKKKGK